MTTRILNVDLPKNKRIEIALTYIYGIGRRKSQMILIKADVDPDIRVKNLADADIARIRNVINNLGEHGEKFEGELRAEIAFNIKRLIEIGCYRGIRHRKGLPVRGQKTKTNARTRKGPRRTIANKKK